MSLADNRADILQIEVVMVVVMVEVSIIQPSNCTVISNPVNTSGRAVSGGPKVFNCLRVFKMESQRDPR